MIKKILAMIKRGLLEILYTKRKGIWALIYILLSIPYIPVIWKITIGNIAFISAFLEFVVKSFLYGSMALGLIVILIVIGRPFKTRNTENKLREIGLINHRGKVPTLCSFGKGSDKKRHEEIWVFLTNGIPKEAWAKKTSDLESVFNRKILTIDYLERTREQIKLNVIPVKYYVPASIDDSFIKDMINLLCVGATGTGKSYFLLTLLSQLKGIYKNNITFVMCDFKNSFSEFSDCPNFYGYTDCLYGLEAVYKEFKIRLDLNDSKRNEKKIAFVIDEYSAFVMFHEKKVADTIKNQIAELLSMSRSLGIIVIIGLQRADSELFKLGARDNFRSILGMGNLSKEQKSMLFNDYKELMMDSISAVGEGYLWRDGKGVEKIKVAPIENMNAVIETIRKGLSEPII
ncbi:MULTISPECIES: hypothetical protein [Mediterraneibacter]|jgi:hypothetical protein|uniref:hypothetical protein n=1 Tax=Mediterraneibacter gnavus TaxID=33038 RepID=UPI000E52ED2A|nr:hypothetical protein [Mediterraneibacter gnavus]RHI81659.1 hypothetical protein DW153_14885 [Mediterraneibacter gnavus]